MSFDLKNGPVFTVFAKWPNGEVEELDIQVKPMPARLAVKAARAEAEKVLADPDEYQPGGKVVRVAAFQGVSITSFG